MEYTIAGLDLLDAQIRILSQNITPNTTLQTISMIRKNIKENEGAEIARNLMSNLHLEKLELEGNKLGPKAAFEMGELIKQNKVIRFIDMENNNLTNSGADVNGIVNIAEALK